jgi:hypothetical protein
MPKHTLRGTARSEQRPKYNCLDVICDWFPGLLLAAGGSGRGGSRSVGRGGVGALILGSELAAAPRIGRLGK